jgi:mannose-6-phosphate isomerase-like protein (cupin superfamily)
VIARARGGSVTLFAFDVGQELSEHTAPYDALVVVLEGTLMLNIGGTQVRTVSGTVVRIPANVPHAVESHERSKMLLVMLRGRNTRRKGRSGFEPPQAHAADRRRQSLRGPHGGRRDVAPRAEPPITNSLS